MIEDFLEALITAGLMCLCLLFAIFLSLMFLSWLLS